MSTKVKCLHCGDIIESKGHRHNFVSCRCGKTFVDGGDEYSRIGGDKLLLWKENENKWINPFEQIIPDYHLEKINKMIKEIKNITSDNNYYQIIVNLISRFIIDFLKENDIDELRNKVLDVIYDKISKEVIPNLMEDNFEYNLLIDDINYKIKNFLETQKEEN